MQITFSPTRRVRFSSNQCRRLHLASGQPERRGLQQARSGSFRFARTTSTITTVPRRCWFSFRPGISAFIGGSRRASTRLAPHPRLCCRSKSAVSASDARQDSLRSPDSRSRRSAGSGCPRRRHAATAGGRARSRKSAAFVVRAYGPISLGPGLRYLLSKVKKRMRG